METNADDSRTFGTSLAVNENYLAIGDIDANRVIVYQRQDDGNWLRKREIKSPENSNAKKIGHGFFAIAYLITN